MEKEQEKGVVYFVYGNIQMAITATKHLIEICEDEKLRKSLADDLIALDKFENRVLQVKGDIKVKPLSNPAKIGTDFAIDMKTLNDKSAEKLCEMLAKGYEKGAKSAAENIRDSDGESRQSMELAKGYLEFCKQNRIKYKGLN